MSTISNNSMLVIIFMALVGKISDVNSIMEAWLIRSKHFSMSRFKIKVGFLNFSSFSSRDTAINALLLFRDPKLSFVCACNSIIGSSSTCISSWAHFATALLIPNGLISRLFSLGIQTSFTS